jgi:predicted transcriptional regulator
MDMTLHVRLPEEWYNGLRRIADSVEGTIHQQAKLAIRDRLEREGMLASPGKEASDGGEA